MRMLADKCNRCGKMVIKHDNIDSSDMIATKGFLLYLGDLLPGESGRPALDLKGNGGDPETLYCPDCLVEEIKEFVAKIKVRPVSNIPINHILPPGNSVSICPICNKP